MDRDLRRLATTHFDVLVIGAGIYGVTAAWDAALRGLSVALIDRGDFGGATSFNSAKTVHGGVRALQSGNMAQLRQYVRERRALCRIAPHLVHPLPFVIPTTRALTRHRALLGLYFAINDFLARDRNDLPDPSKHLPASRVITRDESLRLHPLIDPDGVTGGIIWYDCQVYSTDRMTLAFVLSASAAGAAVANYVEARGFVQEGERVAGVAARDALTDAEFDIRADVVLNVTGPWARTFVDRALPGAGRRLPPLVSKAMNLVTRRIVGDHAVGGSAGSRFLFVAPWRDVAIVGTSHDPNPTPPDALAATRTDVESFLAEIACAFPAARLTLDDIRLVHRGHLPAVGPPGGPARLVKDSHIYDHREDGGAGLISIVGTRYTTARDTARRAVDLVFRTLNRTPPPCRTDTQPLLGGDIPRFDRFLQDALCDRPPLIPESTLRRLAMCYGTAYPTLLQPMLQHSTEAAPLGCACSVTRAEIRHAVRHEMALRLSDAVLRRTEAGSAGHPGADALREAAGIMAAELGWDQDRMRSEIAAVEDVYQIGD